ncbi:MAG: tetratricopeptide repeat protein [Bryobacteraceae bacterium]
MKALISGQAGVAVLIDKDRLSSLHFGSSEPIPRSPTDLAFLLADASDVVELSATTLDKAAAALDLSWRQDRALQLILILLDREADDEARRLSAECLKELLTDTNVSEFICNRLFAAPLPKSADLLGSVILAQAGRDETLERLLEELGESQPQIESRRREWEAMRPETFGGARSKEEFGYLAVVSGAFLRLVQSTPDRVNNVLLTALADRRFSKLPNYREVLMSWIRPVRVTTETLPQEYDEDDQDEGSRKPSLPKSAGLNRSHAVFENVNRQKDAVKQAMSDGRRDRVAQYVDNLVKYQLHRSERVDAAKSLCDLAMYAKQIQAYELQFDLASRATILLPTDGWSQAQLGDACLCTGRYDEAIVAYGAAEAYGQSEVARNGRAEVLKALGRLDDALREYEAAARDFPHDVFARTGRAEVLKALGRLDDALREYESILENLPTDRYARTGKATVLALLSRWEEALSMSSYQLPRTVDDWVDYHLRGMIFLRKGEAQSAISILESGVRECPWHIQRSYFREALAIAKLRELEFSAAIDILDTEPAPVSQVLRIHAFGALGDTRKATTALQLISSNSTPALVLVRDELERRYLKREQTIHSDQWLFERECDLLLAA